MACLYLGRTDELANLPLGDVSVKAFVDACVGRTAEAEKTVTNFLAGVRLSTMADADIVPVQTLLMAAALELGNQEAAVRLSASLEGGPFIHCANLVTCPGRLRATTAALMGERAKARELYEATLQVTQRLGHRPETALTRLGLAELLLDGTAEERGEAQGHLEFAIEEFRAMKMQPSLERALRHKGLLHA